MNHNQPVVGIVPPSGHRRFIRKIRGFIRMFKAKWLALPLRQRIIYAVVAFIVLAFLIFGLWLLLQKPSTAWESPRPEISYQEGASDEPTTTDSADPAADDSTKQDEPKPGQSAKKPGTSGTGGSGGSGGGGSGGGSGGGGEVTPPAEFPNASNTGPSGCSSYAQYSGTLDITTDNTTLNCIELSGTLTINADNVTVQNSILKGTEWWGVRIGNSSSVTNFKLLHSRVYTTAGQGPDNGGYDYGILQESVGYMEIGYNDISGYKDGVIPIGGWIHDNYIHDLSRFVGAHTQAVYIYTSSIQVKVEHNTLINDSPYDQATAAVYIADDDGHQNDRIVTNNFMAGGAYTLYAGDPTATNIVITNNKFSVQCVPGPPPDNEGCYGPVTDWSNNAGNVWSGNTWADGSNSGQTLNPLA